MYIILIKYESLEAILGVHVDEMSFLLIKCYILNTI